MEVTDGKIIEDLIRRQNIRHFAQESDTPLATNETIDQFGFTESTEITQKILAVCAPIKDKMMQGYRNWKEQTTKSPLSR